MNNKSAFQQKNPLSRKKIWKKMFPCFFANLVSSLVIAIFIAVGKSSSIGVTYENGTAAPDYPKEILLHFVLAYLILNIIYYIYYRAYINRYYYDGENNFLTIKKGVFAPTEIHVQYRKIQDVYVDQDFLDRIMGLYDVHIASATFTSGIEAHIDGVEKKVAENLKNYLLDSINNNDNYSSIPEISADRGSAKAIKLDQDVKISSESFPILGKWVTMSAVNFVFWWIMITLFFFGSVKLYEPIQLFGQNNTILFYVCGLIFVLMIISFVFGTVLWRSYFRFEFKTDSIYFYQGVITKTEKHLPYNKIQDVIVRQGLTERMFGLATVIIQNAAMGFGIGMTGMVIQGQSLENANKIASVVREIMSKNKNSVDL